MIRVGITKEGIATIGKRGFRRVGRAAIEAPAMHWWRVFLPLHYKNTSFRRYKYTRRSDKYSDTKLQRESYFFGDDKTKAIGEDLPHVFSGRSRERALSSPNIKARARRFDKYQATVLINAPVYNFSTNKRINLRDEVTRFTPQENSKMGRIFASTWSREFKRERKRARKKRKNFKG